jgi:4,5-DOPA dioxygenase extradiol
MNVTKIQNHKMPVIFIGHGSPMNIVADNDFTKSLQALSKTLHPHCKAILAISAHWETMGTEIQSSVQPKTIYDFYGFPEALYKVTYRAQGSPQLATEIQKNSSPQALLTEDWGLDHGTWSVLCHMPELTNVPVVQMSLNRNFKIADHIRFAQQFSFLRQQGVLIFASGNLVHNLRTIDWNTEATPYDWAIEFDQLIAQAIRRRDIEWIQNLESSKDQKLFKQAHPSLDHFIPLAYALGTTNENDESHWIFEGFQNKSISMRSVIFR